MSPFELLQEIYIDDPWKSLICCILLNCTKRAQVDGIRDQLFRDYPNAEIMASANSTELAALLKPLGFYNKRANTLIRFSKDWLTLDWKRPKELYGIGQYASDSYDIFYNNVIDIEPNDGVLVKYVEWKRQYVSQILD